MPPIGKILKEPTTVLGIAVLAGAVTYWFAGGAMAAVIVGAVVSCLLRDSTSGPEVQQEANKILPVIEKAEDSAKAAEGQHKLQ